MMESSLSYSFSNEQHSAVKFKFFFFFAACCCSVGYTTRETVRWEMRDERGGMLDAASTAAQCPLRLTRKLNITGSTFDNNI